MTTWDIMKYMYICPECEATLNPNTKIILTASNRDTRGLVLLSPQPGNYKAIVSEDLYWSPGDVVVLRCPVCAADLQSALNENLAKINFSRSDGLLGKVTFSRRVGEQATYFVTNETVRSYGVNANIYGGVNFFGEARIRE